MDFFQLIPIAAPQEEEKRNSESEGPEPEPPLDSEVRNRESGRDVSRNSNPLPFKTS